MTSNQKLLADAGAVLGAFGVRKTDVHTTANMQAGEFMNKTQMERMVDLTVSQSQWLPAVTLRTRAQRSGEIPRLTLNDIVTEGTSENAGDSPTTRAQTDFIAYNCKKFKSTWYLTVEDAREARASGEPEFEAKLRRAFAKAIGNDMALWMMQGDTSLDASSRRNRLLRHQDGWLKQARAVANRATTTYGSAYTSGLWPAVKTLIPEEYREDSALRFLIPSDLDTAHTEEIGDYIAGGSRLADRARVERIRFAPRGIPQLIIPQLPTTQGFATLNGSAVDPNSVTDNTGNITFNVTNLFGGYNAKWVGRRIRVTLIATGASEVVTVTDGGSTLLATTQGTLGQSTVSTTVGAYALDVADTTSVLCTNPANLYIVLCDQMRAYRKFEQEHERWRVDLYYEADCGIFNENALAIQDGVALPTFTFGE